MSRTDDELVGLMYEYASTLNSWVVNGDVTHESLGRSDIIQAAVVKYLELVGEQAWILHKRGCDLGDGVNLRDMGAMRHRLVHAYDGINWSYVEDAVFNDIPELVSELSRVMRDSDGASGADL